ncbi:traB domain-containing protein-like [Aricia agestis]|uniref:traB domain-containing protein-like n=1 Tax=Aricia agestis TaxID=91739 RepID=UPI001C209690|nr:traB domain-containing protein-like [Aricia agestis]
MRLFNFSHIQFFSKKLLGHLKIHNQVANYNFNYEATNDLDGPNNKVINIPCDDIKSKLPPTAKLLQCDNNATVALLGTVHFSKKSINDVSEVVKIMRPNGILVELCHQRLGILELDEQKFIQDAKNLDRKRLKEAVKGHGFISGFLHTMLLKTYAELAKEFRVAPGGEFRRAYHEVKKIPGCKLFLGDRPMRITIDRALKTLSVMEFIQIIYHLTTSKPVPINRAHLEKYKDTDFIKEQFEQITREVPAFKKIFNVLVDERDKCLAYSIQEAVRMVKEPRILAVVGMGHVNGIYRYYGKLKYSDIMPLLINSIFRAL